MRQPSGANGSATIDVYARRIQRVVDYVRRNLEGDLSLARLAKEAWFSPFHFHRIFKACTGETVGDHVRRARLERAVCLMRAAPTRELGSIALEVGFGTPSDLSRAFKQTYGIAPSRWDRVSRLDRARHVAADILAATPVPTVPDPVVRAHAAVRLACVQVKNPWTGPEAIRDGYAALTAWLDARQIDWRRRPLLGMTWDSELATPIEQLVYDLGFGVPDEVAPEGRIAIRSLPAMSSAEIRCQGLREVALAWEHMYRSWLPRSGYEPDEIPAIKRFVVVPDVFDAGAWHVDCSIAVRRRRR